MISKFGPLGFQPSDRYRNVAESRIVDMLVFAGWLGQPASLESREAAKAVLETWTRNGLASRPSPDGKRSFDPIEVYNHMKLAGVQERDSFFSEKYSLTRRNCVADFAATISANEGRRFTVDFQRTFYLPAVDPHTRLRLRMPLPLTGDDLFNLQVTPHQPDHDAQTTIGSGRLDARLAAAGRTTAILGATLTFTARQRVPQPQLEPPDPAPYLASREGLIVISDRIRALAQNLASSGAPPLEAIFAFWDYIHAGLVCGLVHYDQVDAASPCDWVLDSGWYDCHLASALFVALCRAHGISSRVVGGYFLYPASPTNHFWAEVWIDDQGWTPFDFFGWDISDGGRRGEWRDRFFGRLEPRLITERLPREFTGALGVPIPHAWCILQTSAPGGVEINFLDVSSAPIYTDIVRVTA
jgi:hypothetical protein